MAIKEEFKKFEEKNKQEYMEGVELIFSEQNEKINGILHNSKIIGKDRVAIPNIGITFNNKIGEISREFKKMGASIFASEIENYGQYNINAVTASFVGDSIIYDLLRYVVEANNIYREYDDTVISIINSKTRQLEILENITPIQKIWRKIKSLFINVEPIDLSPTDKEEWYLEDIMEECQYIDNELWEYNWKAHIMNGISTLVYDRGYEAYEVPDLLEESVYPELKKLGLEDRIPELQQKIIETYKQNIPESEINEISDMHLYIPNFENKSENSKKEIVPQIIRELNEETKKIIINSHNKVEDLNEKQGETSDHIKTEDDGEER